MCIAAIAVIAVLIPVLLIAWLYSTANLQKPIGLEPTNRQLTIISDSLRACGTDTLHLSRDGWWEIKLGGQAFERGESFGKLTQDILYQQEKSFIDQIREFVPSDRYLNFLKYLTLTFNHSLGKYINEEYRNEIYGVSLSCSPDFNFVCEPYERQMNYHSAHDVGHVMQDYMLVGCSSFAAWGSCSADGNLVVGRNFDFYMGDDFARNRILMFCKPDSGYSFASVSWPCMIGVMSGMNEKGLTVSINAAKSAMPTSSATPISILCREILQYASTIDEAYQIASNRRTFVSESILIGSMADSCAVVIEKSPEQIALRRTDSLYIISTNHYLSDVFSHDERNLENIATSDSPLRYKRISELMHNKFPIGVDDAAAILRDYKGVGGIDIGLTNELAINQFIGHHSVIFCPTRMLMWVSTSPWQAGPYIAYNLADIFSGKTSFARGAADYSLTIPDDPLITANNIDNLLIFKQITHKLRTMLKQNIPADSALISQYISLNPELYAAHELAGDLYSISGNIPKAAAEWQTALEKVIPKAAERTRIENKLAATAQ